MQAEIDKYVSTCWLLRRQWPQRFPAELHPLLFERTRIDAALAGERAGLYRTATQLCGAVLPRHRSDGCGVMVRARPRRRRWSLSCGASTGCRSARNAATSGRWPERRTRTRGTGRARRCAARRLTRSRRACGVPRVRWSISATRRACAGPSACAGAAVGGAAPNGSTARCHRAGSRRGTGERPRPQGRRRADSSSSSSTTRSLAPADLGQQRPFHARVAALVVFDAAEPSPRKVHAGRLLRAGRRLSVAVF